MSNQAIRTKVFINVMTYPHPSRGYQELVCTAGITEQGEWVRLYPIDYRYRPRNQQFRKYQWIEVDLFPYGAGNDRRKESRKPILDTLRVLGEPLSTKNGWRERRQIIDPVPVYTVKQLRELHESERVSLGIVQPTKVLDLKIESADPEWKPEWQSLFDQLTLFGPVQKPLRKIPYKFSYVFECNDSSRPHNAMIEDWELGVLWLNEVARLGDEEQAALSVRRKFLDELCNETKDTRFFMGTVFPYNTWVVLGVFWPPKPKTPQPDVIQGTLF
ncbi:hypothetical protein NDI45_12575 [Leptolyngbya sp. GB1-A1]|uniref:hypothetical protein n=1 Tax=Leptolyngbya sp. GB1-A1 TaxID=2933908 RepID=UPI003297D14B